MSLAQPPTQARHALARLMGTDWLSGPKMRSFTVEGAFTLYDIDAELYWLSLLQRWPSFCFEDALPFLAADRRIIIGPEEPVATQRARLRSWIDEWSLSGLPIGWLLAVQAYLAPAYPRVRIVTRRGTWYTLEEGSVGRLLNLDGFTPLPRCTYETGAGWPLGAVASQIERLRGAGLFSRVKASPNNWDWDSISDPGAASRWWDFWAILYPTSYPFQGLYNGAPPNDVYYGENTGWGLDANPGTLFTLRLIMALRKSAKSYLKAVIFAPSSTDFDPTTAPGDPGFPDGMWSAHSKDVAGVATPTRRTDCRYILNIDQ